MVLLISILFGFVVVAEDSFFVENRILFNGEALDVGPCTATQTNTDNAVVYALYSTNGSIVYVDERDSELSSIFLAEERENFVDNQVHPGLAVLFATGLFIVGDIYVRYWQSFKDEDGDAIEVENAEKLAKRAERAEQRKSRRLSRHSVAVHHNASPLGSPRRRRSTPNSRRQSRRHSRVEMSTVLSGAFTHGFEGTLPTSTFVSNERSVLPPPIVSDTGASGYDAFGSHAHTFAPIKPTRTIVSPTPAPVERSQYAPAPARPPNIAGESMTGGAAATPTFGAAATPTFGATLNSGETRGGVVGRGFRGVLRGRGGLGRGFRGAVPPARGGGGVRGGRGFTPLVLPPRQ